ncbi:MAG TPA: serine/threonine-protein kinase, partial [Hymenobacter sp.]|nr:serine/threonine-protein kinase [Hymenobacter sp.]
MPTVSFNQHFPGYDVLGEINRSNARVLKARHIATGDLVAIKHFSLNTDADTLRRFERESVIMTQMEHPNIVRVREVRLEAELPYIVMDYVEGGSVRGLITEQGSLSVEMTIRLGLQVLSAFRVIHTQGIVHRDVKPENILYHKLASGELHFLLTDFGVARLHQQPVTMTGQSLMTYEYAAPEQFDNPRQVDEAADYYAFGVVLYECLTGQVPFAMRGETGMATFMNAVLTMAPPDPVLPSSQPLPDSLDTLIRQLLVKSPTERIHNPDLVKLALKQAEVEQLHQETGQSPIPAASPNQSVR